MEESIAKRYFSKIAGNIGAGIIFLANQSIVARTLGAATYGKYTFIQSHFEGLITDLGFSNALFTRVSQDRKNYESAAALFIVISGLVTLALGVYICAVFLMGKSQFFWPEIPSNAVWISLFLAAVIFLGRISVLISDAAGNAKRIEVFRVLRAIFTFCLLAIFSLTKQLTLTRGMWIFLAGHLVFLFLSISFGHRSLQGKRLDFSLPTLKKTLLDVWPLAGPIVLYSLLTLFPSVFDRWFLQYVSGSFEQSYYSLGLQISTALFLATCALTSIFQRETSLAFAASDSRRLHSLFTTYTLRIFAVAAVPALFVATHASMIAKVLGGQSLVDAGPTIAILAIYPIIQGSGQLSVAFQYATNRSKLFLIVGVVRDAIGVLLAIILVGSGLGIFPGYSLGSVGLAIKSVIAVCITTYVMHYSNCRYLKLSFKKHLAQELRVISFLALVSLLTKEIAIYLLSNLELHQPIAVTVVAGGLYIAGVLVLVFSYPKIFGLDHKLLFRFFPRLRAVS